MSSRDLSEEPPDPKWLSEEAARRREHEEREKAQHRIARMAQRGREPLSARLHRVETATVLIATPPAGNIAGSEAGGKAVPGSKLLRRGEADEMALAGEDRREVQRIFHLVRDGISKLEQLVDEHRGLSGPRSAMDTVDLNKLLLQYEGRTPEDVSRVEPSLGSPAAVRKSRALLKRKREDGRAVV